MVLVEIENKFSGDRAHVQSNHNKIKWKDNSEVFDNENRVFLACISEEAITLTYTILTSPELYLGVPICLYGIKKFILTNV